MMGTNPTVTEASISSSEASYYKWKTKYGGMQASDIDGCVNWKKKTGD
jgi:hypothetical protein